MKKDDHGELKEFLSVGEMSKRSGVAISAIHFYESKGLLRAFRNPQNQRRYARGFLRILSFIKTAQLLGFSLEQIQEMLSKFPVKDKPTEADWQKLARRWQHDLDEKIRMLSKIRKQLDSCIGCGCLSLKDCPLRNENDRLGNKGPGAHLI